jgi:uncharacterized membrane protein YqjE
MTRNGRPAVDVTLSWQALVAAVVLILVVGLVAIVWLSRDPRSHRVRFGVFLERDDHQQPPD